MQNLPMFKTTNFDRFHCQGVSSFSLFKMCSNYAIDNVSVLFFHSTMLWSCLYVLVNFIVYCLTPDVSNFGTVKGHSPLEDIWIAFKSPEQLFKPATHFLFAKFHFVPIFEDLGGVLQEWSKYTYAECIKYTPKWNRYTPECFKYKV